MKPNSKKTITKKDFNNELSLHPGLELNLEGSWKKIEGGVLENMRVMISRIQKNGGLPRRLVIFSALSGEGVTSVCVGMGGTLANDYSAKVCLVDLNWYSPSTLLPESSNGLGIADVLNNTATLAEAIKPTGKSGFFVLPAGKMEEYKRPVIARSKALGDLLSQLEDEFDYLILDIPAILSTSDAVHLAAHGQGCCLVIRQGITPVQDVRLALDDVSHLPILGVVINRVSFSTPDHLIRLLGA